MSLLLRLVPDRDLGRHLLLDEGERVKDVVRHHWIVFVVPYLLVACGFVVFVLGFFGPIQVGWLLFIAGIGLGAWGVYRAAYQHLDVFVITNFRVLKIRGVFEVKIATMPMARILDVTVDRPFIGRLLGFGHFIFESAAQSQGLRDIRFISDPYGRDREIQRALQEAGLRGPAPR
ncbi:UNVERIFIED_CONTAM: membrane-flanked domain protein [Mumia flava]